MDAVSRLNAVLRRSALPLLALAVLALASVAAAAQTIPDAAMDAVPGGQTSVLGMLLVTIAYLGRLILARPSPEEHARLIRENEALRAEVRDLNGRLIGAYAGATAVAGVRIPVTP